MLLAQILQISNSRGKVKMLLVLMLLKGRFSLIDLSRKTIVWNQDQRFDALIISVKEILNGLRSTGIERAQGILESQLLFEDPGQSTLPYKNAGGKLAEKGGIKLVELFLHFEVLR